MHNRIKGILTFIFCFISNPSWACSVCFYGQKGETHTEALRWGIFSLMLVLLSVLSLIAVFFINIIKRSKQIKPV